MNIAGIRALIAAPGLALPKPRRKLRESVVLECVGFFGDLAGDQARRFCERPGAVAPQGCDEPTHRVLVHDSGRTLCPDDKLNQRCDQKAAPSIIGAANMTIQLDQQLGFLSRIDAVWQDVPLQSLNIPEADAAFLAEPADVFGKRNLAHLIMPPRVLLDAGVVPDGIDFRVRRASQRLIANSESGFR